MKKIILLIMLISGIVKAQTFDFSCAPTLENGYFDGIYTINTTEYVNVVDGVMYTIGSRIWGAYLRTYIIQDQYNGDLSRFNDYLEINTNNELTVAQYDVVKIDAIDLISYIEANRISELTDFYSHGFQGMYKLHKASIRTSREGRTAHTEFDESPWYLEVTEDDVIIYKPLSGCYTSTTIPNETAQTVASSLNDFGGARNTDYASEHFQDYTSSYPHTIGPVRSWAVAAGTTIAGVDEAGIATHESGIYFGMWSQRHDNIYIGTGWQLRFRRTNDIITICN